MSATATTTRTIARLCTCGCGTPVNKATSLYAPGHDARHAGHVASALAVVRPDNSDLRETVLGALPSAALRAKAVAAAERLVARNTKATALKGAKAEAKSVQPVKVGRWTYPAMRKGAVLLRNTKRDGSGEWVAV
jgi:hypothetical protein